ncbi:MAG TPA: FCD domain-containing protein [Thermomicrobiales bacterium]|nr:FCD domain-containing protein [Thermomicrobiales bacterium]
MLDRLEAFAPPSRDSLADRVVVILKRFIIVEGLETGARMPPERHLAETLNVSRTVLREALSRLIGEGVLVRSSPRVLELASFDHDALAASVSLLGDREMHFRDLMELRYILEIGALPVIITKLTDASLAQIEESLQAYEAGRRAGNAGHGLDVQFHATLLRALDNDTVNSMLPLIEEQIRDYLFFDPLQLRASRPDPTDRVVNDHRAIVEAIRNRSPQDAVLAMERHLSPYFEALQRRNGE